MTFKIAKHVYGEYAYVYPHRQLSVKYSEQHSLPYSITENHSTLRSEVLANVKTHNVIFWFITPRRLGAYYSLSADRVRLF